MPLEHTASHAASHTETSSRTTTHQPAGQVSVLQSINAEAFAQAKALFTSADAARTGRLNLQQWTSALLGKTDSLGGGNSLEALKQYFVRVDADADGYITWRDLSTYMISQKSDSTGEDEATCLLFEHPEAVQEVPDKWPHHDDITDMVFLPAPSAAKGTIASVGKDSSIRVWKAANLSFLKSVNVGSAWLTGCCVSPLSQRLCVSTMARSISFYDFSTLAQCGKVTDLEHAPTCLDAWKSLTGQDEFMALGSYSGFISLHRILEVYGEDRTSSERWSLEKRHQTKAHSDVVTQVKYSPQLEHMFACSTDRSLSMLDGECKAVVRRFIGHRRAINALEFSQIYKVAITAGQDRQIIFWNPYAPQPMARLQGHQAGIVDVVLDERNNQLISLSADQTIKVWDIRKHRCLQTMVYTDLSIKQKFKLSTIKYDQHRQRIITGSILPRIWPRKQATGQAGTSGKGHGFTVVAAAFNEAFLEMVTGDESGRICVWSMEGKLLRQWDAAAAGQTLTALTLDTPQRRLLTAFDDGSGKVWNVSSSQILRVLTAACRVEATAITHIQLRGERGGSFFGMVGWAGSLVLYPDMAFSRAGAEAEACQILHAPPWRGPSASQLAASSQFSPRMDPKLKKPQQTSLLALAWHPERRLMAAGDTFNRVIVWSLLTYAVDRVLQVEMYGSLGEAGIDQVMFLEMGKRLYVAATANRSSITIWDLEPHSSLTHTFRPLLQVTDDPAAEISAACTDGKDVIVLGDTTNTITVWHLRCKEGVNGGPSEAALELELTTAWQGFQDAIGMVSCITGSLGDWLLSAAGPEVQLTNLFDQKTINLQV
ncbi:hypothetical protein WJX74_006828 [Apatococcus lobatus]|uniref:EF-hand domain-containing protein n=1 Tax=Apatococcus lobatus TaxID=904363 RepID=A0AAW1QX58_9CHLO